MTHALGPSEETPVSDYMMVSAGGGHYPVDVRKAEFENFFGQSVRVVTIADGTKGIVINDAIAAIGSSTFPPRFLEGKCLRLGQIYTVNDGYRTEPMRVGSLTDINVLVMESTSANASQFKDWAAPILAEVMRTGSYGKPAELKPTGNPIADLALSIYQTQLQIDSLAADAKKAQETSVKALECANAAMDVIENRTGYEALLTFLTLRKARVPIEITKEEGAKLSAECRRRGIETYKVSRGGYAVNTYPEWLLEEWLPGFKARHPEFFRPRGWFGR
jgi:prophage antirepressor-like protein